MDLTATLRELGVNARAGAGDDAIDGHVPGCVARPDSTAQVSAVMRAAHEHGATTIVRGNGTKQSFGGVAPAADLVLDLSRMTRLLEHQPGDLIVRAEAGMRLAQLQAHLLPSGQRLGIDEPVPGSTLGGVIATNTSGPRRLHTGTARDLLIGVTLVLADGTIAKSGGKVVKNVAGYDLGKLLVGSFGTLAVVTEATFRLHPVPPRSTWVSARVAAGALEPTLERLCHSQLAPSALEIDWQPGQSATVAVLIEGTEAGVPERVEAVAAELGAPDATRDEPAWPWLFPAPPDGSATLLKLTCRLGAVAELAAAATGLGLHVRGAAGTGVLYAAVPDALPVDRLDEILSALRLRAAVAGGACVVLSAPLSLRERIDVWGQTPGLSVMRRLKEQFDPERLLAPGRFVGGI